jgi:hypothetical protein
MSTSVVCYHYPCTDGIFSALAAHLHFQQHHKPVRFVPLTVFKAPTVDDLKLQARSLTLHPRKRGEGR